MAFGEIKETLERMEGKLDAMAKEIKRMELIEGHLVDLIVGKRRPAPLPVETVRPVSPANGEPGRLSDRK